MEAIIFQGDKKSTLSEKYIELEIKRFFYHKEKQPRYKKDLGLDERVNQIVNVLADKRDIIKGFKPSNETLERIKNNISNCINTSSPIGIVISWGCIKTPNFCQDGIDIAEFIALEQFININQKVLEYYDKGMEFNIFLGDEWYDFIYGYRKGIEDYCSGFEKLIEIMNLENIQVSRLSYIINYSDKDRLIEKAKRYFESLKWYWSDSEKIPEKDWTKLESYNSLVKTGFKGILPNIMREFFIDKMNRYLPNAGFQEKLEAIWRYFAYGLMIIDEDLLGRNKCAIDFSLISPPPGAPDKCIFDHRLRMRSMPYEATKKGYAPWVSGGIIISEEGNFRPSSITDYDLQKYILIQPAILKVFNNKKKHKQKQ